MKKRILSIVGLLLIAFLYYYIALPAVNIHAVGFWIFLIILLVLCLAVYTFVKVNIKDPAAIKKNKIVRIGVIVIGATAVVFLVGAVLSSPIVNADKYQKLLTIEEREFIEDIEEVSYNQIPLLDKESAAMLGNRKMGTMVDMVSQFEVSDLYSQINYQGEPVRVTPLVYASPIKWLTNRKEGIPAYIKIDMATQNTELVKLENGMKYSYSEYLNRNIYRHLRFRYPTYIFDSINFEIDDDGTPFWICPVKKFNIGLFGGQTIGKVVVCNAVTGDTQVYDLEDCPNWIDKVHSAELLIELYDYHGTLKHGYFNSILGQRDCLETTDGYNYLALDDDVWVYTGITSVSGDQSNVGFVLMNQRTKETRYYPVNGAEEYSAMASAEGQVQHLGYSATFPLLLNIANEPTYFIALKDDAGLVKMYAMVSVEKYQNVAIGDNVAECEKEYIALLKKEGGGNTSSGVLETASGKISKIAEAVVDGNSHYYIMLENSEEIFDILIADHVEFIRYNEGDSITIEYAPGDTVHTVLGIE